MIPYVIKNNPVTLPTIDFPLPVISFAVKAKEKGDEEKVGTGLSRLLEEDPTLRMEKSPETKETLVSGMGELHVDIVVDRLVKKFGVDVDLKSPKIPYKETIKSSVKVEAKHKKQSGGRGQYGHVFIELSPLPRGTGSNLKKQYLVVLYQNNIFLRLRRVF